jgi:hypothetical protein
MELERPYCPVCKRKVAVATTPAPRHRDGHASIPDEPRGVCLDFGDACDPRPTGVQALRHRGAECPVFHVPAVVMGVTRARTGLTPEPRPELETFCEGCGKETRQERVGPALAFCRTCGSTSVVGLKGGRPE